MAQRSLIVHATDSFNRPANTTGYVAQDAVMPTPARMLDFSADLRKGALLKILSALLFTSAADVPATSDYQLNLLSDAMASIPADNAASYLPHAERAKALGVIRFTPSGGMPSPSLGYTSVLMGSPGSLLGPYETWIKLPDNGDKLYGVLVCMTDHDPKSAEGFRIELVLEVL